MYTLVNTLVKDRGRSGRWHEINGALVTLVNLWETYADAYLILSNPVIGHEVSLRVADIRLTTPYNEASMLIPAWLTSLGNASLPTRDEVPVINPRFVTYGDARQAGYSIKPVDRLINVNTVIPRSECEDLLLTKEGMDYELFNQYGVVSVNGFLHMIDPSVDGIYVYDGYTSSRIANDVNVGIWNFYNLGPIQRVPITREMVMANPEGVALKNYADILLDMDLTGKTVLTVLGGYLHTLDKQVKQLGEKTFRVDVNNISLIDRYFESRNFLDFSNLYEIMTQKNGTYDQLDLEEFYSDEWITRYLTMSQSFFIVIETPEIFIDRLELEKLPCPGRFLTGDEPVQPVIYGFGRAMEYHRLHDHGRWVVAGQRGYQPIYNYKTTQWADNISLDPTRLSSQPVRLPRAHLLKIGRDL